MWLWTLLLVGVILFELWYAAAFLFAYAQLRERMLLMPVAQALLMAATFTYLTITLMNGWTAHPLVIFPLLILAMLIAVYWRRVPNGLPVLLRSYPRGTLDVLAFRRPAVDLKRRVRTK